MYGLKDSGDELDMLEAPVFTIEPPGKCTTIPGCVVSVCPVVGLIIVDIEEVTLIPLLDDEPLAPENITAGVEDSAVLVGLTAFCALNPLGSTQRTGLCMVNKYKFAACRMLSGLHCILPTFQKGSG